MKRFAALLVLVAGLLVCVPEAAVAHGGGFGGGGFNSFRGGFRGSRGFRASRQRVVVVNRAPVYGGGFRAPVHCAPGGGFNNFGGGYGGGASFQFQGQFGY
jgi:hypothetical protein